MCMSMQWELETGANMTGVVSEVYVMYRMRTRRRRTTVMMRRQQSRS